MTVQSEVSRVSYSGDDSTVAFSTTFYFLANADLRVIIRDVNGIETLQVTGTDYSVTGAGNANGGTVTFVSAPVVGDTVVIIRDPPLTQLTDYNDQDPFPADSHERALDKLTMLISRLAEKFARSVLLQETSTLTGLVFPNPEPGKFFRWNGKGDAIENATFAEATETFPTTASRYLRRNDEGTAYSSLSAAQSANLDAIRDMGIGSQVVFTDAANAITADHAGKTLIANRGSAISFDFDPAADLGERFWVEIKNAGAGTLTINPDGAETIDGNASETAEQDESLKVYSNGTALISVKYAQPLDSDLEAIAALSTTPFGRGLLELANQAALQAAVNVEDGADVTDETNVVAALDGATLPTATVSGSDKVLLQDADDNDELKTATAQAIADLATGGAQIATGTYTGDGSTGQAITGVGFQPKFLLIIRGSGSTPLSLDGDVAFAIDAQLSEDGRSVIWNSSGSRFDRDTDAITALGADGFTVDDDGADRSPNANGYTYTYVAIG